MSILTKVASKATKIKRLTAAKKGSGSKKGELVGATQALLANRGQSKLGAGPMGKGTGKAIASLNKKFSSK